MINREFNNCFKQQNIYRQKEDTIQDYKMNENKSNFVFEISFEKKFLTV